MSAKTTSAGPTASSEQGYPGFRWLVLILASLGCISMQMVNLSIAPLVPVIAASLNTDPGTATNVLMTSFLFSGSVMWVVVGGYICDRFGVIVTLILGFLCLAVPTALMPWIGASTTGILWARMIEGLSTGFMFPVVPAVVNAFFPPRQKGIANGLMNSSVAVGSSAGVFLGPLVLKAVGDWKIMSATLSIFIWACLVMGIILFVAYNAKLPKGGATAADEGKGSVFKQALLSPFTIVGVAMFFLTAWAMQCMYSLTGGYLAADRPLGAGYGGVTAGQLMLGVTLLAGVTGPILSGFLLDKAFRGNAKPVMLIGYFLMCVFVYALLSGTVTGSAGVLELDLILAGYGVMFAFPMIFYMIASSYPPQIVGKMSGLWGGIGSFGGVVGLYIAGLTVKSQGSYHTTLFLQSLVALLGFVLTFVLMALKKRHLAA
jgi:MFS family permease